MATSPTSELSGAEQNFPELNEWPWYVDDSVLKAIREKRKRILNHLNSIEPGVIIFTMEEEEDNKLAVLDLGCNVNRKLKKLEFEVHYQKTNTNITIKKKSNHKDNIKKGIIKGFGDRARRALCYPQYLEAELENVEAVFVENGYTKKEVSTSSNTRERTTNRLQRRGTDDLR